MSDKLGLKDWLAGTAAYKCHRAFAIPAPMVLRQAQGWSELGLCFTLALADNLPSPKAWLLPELLVPPEQIPINRNTFCSRHQSSTHAAQPAQHLPASPGRCAAPRPAPIQPIAQHLILPHSLMLSPVLSSPPASLCPPSPLKKQSQPSSTLYPPPDE